MAGFPTKSETLFTDSTPGITLDVQQNYNRRDFFKYLLAVKAFVPSIQPSNKGAEDSVQHNYIESSAETRNIISKCIIYLLCYLFYQNP